MIGEDRMGQILHHINDIEHNFHITTPTSFGLILISITVILHTETLVKTVKRTYTSNRIS